MANDSDHYVYMLFRRTGIPFYVGKGRGKRWLEHEYCAKRGRSHKDNIICQMLSAGLEVPKVKIAENLTNEQAVALEIAFIAAIGREPTGPLTNLTRGGDGVVDMTPEIRAKHRTNTSAGQLGKKRSLEARAAMSRAQRGKLHGPHSPQFNERMREIMASPEQRAAHSALTMKGRKHSEETKAKMRAAAIGRKNSEEARRKMSLAKQGRRASEETRAKMSRAQTLRYSHGQ